MDLVLSKTLEAAAGRKFEIIASFPGELPSLKLDFIAAPY